MAASSITSCANWLPDMRAVLAALPLALAVAACDTAPPAVQAEEVVSSETAEVLTIDSAALAEKLSAGNVQLIDVRTPEEFAEGHIEGAINIPVDDFDPAALPDAEGKERILYCRSARRSGIAAERLSSHSGKAATHLEGGILAWLETGQPTVTPADSAE